MHAACCRIAGIGRASVAVTAVNGIELTTRFWITGVGRAEIVVVANPGCSRTYAALTSLVHRAGIAVVTGGAIDYGNKLTAAGSRIAAVGCARIVVIADRGRAFTRHFIAALYTDIVRGAGIVIVTDRTYRPPCAIYNVAMIGGFIARCPGRARIPRVYAGPARAGVIAVAILAVIAACSIGNRYDQAPASRIANLRFADRYWD
jgi:hypothetical protein